MNNKTNSPWVIFIPDYKRWVCDHILKAADIALRPKVIAPFEEANEFIEKVKIDFSAQENCFGIKSLATQSIPSPELLIKDHNKTNKKGKFLTRLVFLATNFNRRFSKLSYLGIQRMQDKVKVNHWRFTIVQASELKERLEYLEMKRYIVTI